MLVVPEGWEEPATLLADDLVAGKVAAAVTGGSTRAASVAAGLAAVPDDADLILVHDAARPFATPELVSRVLEALGQADGAVPGVPLTDTVKRVSAGLVVETPDRSAAGGGADAAGRSAPTCCAARTRSRPRCWRRPPTAHRWWRRPAAGSPSSRATPPTSR